ELKWISHDVCSLISLDRQYGTIRLAFSSQEFLGAHRDTLAFRDHNILVGSPWRNHLSEVRPRLRNDARASCPRHKHVRKRQELELKITETGPQSSNAQ